MGEAIPSEAAEMATEAAAEFLARIDALEAENAALKVRVEQLESDLQVMKSQAQGR